MVLGVINLILILALFPKFVYSSAFLIYNQDARSNGMGLATVASVDSAASVFFNPAKLPFLKETGFSVNATFLMPSMKFKDEFSEEGFHSRERFHHLYSLYAYKNFERFSIGFGIFSPFGLSTKWEEGFPGRYYAKYSLLRTVFLNPVLSCRISSKSSFAFGLSYIWGKVRFDSSLPISPPYDGLVKLKGEGESLGFNLAFFRELRDDLSFGFSFRSSSKMKFMGEGKIFFPNPSPEIVRDAYIRFILPHVLSVGISKRFANLVLELDLLHTGWARTGNYYVRSEEGVFDRSIRKRWRNTISPSFGINYRLMDNLEIMTGYMYDVSPVPDSTRGPELPDSTRNIISLGGTYYLSEKRLNFCYQATFFRKAKSSLIGLTGHYRNFAHLILISFDY